MPLRLSPFIGPMLGQQQGINLAGQQQMGQQQQGFNLAQAMMDIQQQREKIDLMRQQGQQDAAQQQWERTNMSPYQQAMIQQRKAEFEGVPGETKYTTRAKATEAGKEFAREFVLKDYDVSNKIKFMNEAAKVSFENDLKLLQAKHENDILKSDLDKQHDIDMLAAKASADAPYKQAMTAEAYARVANYARQGNIDAAEIELKKLHGELYGAQTEYWKERAKTEASGTATTKTSFPEADVKVLFDSHFKGRGPKHVQYWDISDRFISAVAKKTNMNKYDPQVIDLMIKELQNPNSEFYKFAVEQLNSKDAPEYLTNWYQKLKGESSKRTTARGEKMGIEQEPEMGM